MKILNLKISKILAAILLLVFVGSAYAAQEMHEAPSRAMSASESSGFSGKVIFNSVIPANRKIALGINPEGHLNTRSGNVVSNAGATGIAYKWHAGGDRTEGSWQDATSPGCLCEGWGVSGNGQQGWANVAKRRSGGSNLRVKSFESSAAHITSIVEMGPTGNEVLQVTHEYSPSPEARHMLFQGIVTITNISDKKVENVRYRREMDWDIPPTEFREYVSHFGVVDSLAAADKPKLLYACDNGFLSSTPLTDGCRRIRSGTFNTDFEHSGPADHGSSFNFALPDLDCGESISFMIYYGVAITRDKAKEAVAAVGAEVYSFGASRDARDGVTFIFGFKGISGVRLPTDLPPKAASLPNIAKLQTFAPLLPYGNALYQATFRYRKDKQWKGHVTKYNLSETGKILAASKIDAGQLLSSIPAESRRIWTATNGSLSSAKSNDNFTTANLSVLKAALYRDVSPAPTDTKARDLIQFVRGVDSYDENLDGNFTQDRNWKLADTFHANLAIAPPPRDLDQSASIKSRAQYKRTRAMTYESFVASNTLRETLIYVAANDGMLHAFGADDMNERWAFVPPPLLDKLRGMFNEKGDGEAIKGKTNSIYLADGSITIRDIYYDGKWRTVLIASLGYGGKGLYALDITKPRDPEHLFSVKHDNTKRLIEYWDADGTLTFYDYMGGSFPAALDYSKLGESWSRPFITLIPYEGALKWVAVVGAGYSGVDGKEAGYGRYVYVLDLEPNAAQDDKIGTVLAKVELTEYAGSDVPNAVVASVSALTVDSASNADYYGNLMYIADLQGSVWKFDLAKNELLDSDTGLFGVERHLNAESTLANDRLMYHKPVVSFDGNTPQYFVGTGDMVRRDRLEGVINNRIFAFKDKDFPLHANADSTIPFTMRDLADASTSCATSEQKGWYQNLSSLLSPSLGAKVIGEAAMFSNSTDVYFSTYVPSSDLSCSAEGSSYLLTMDKSCGTETVAEIKIGDGLATTPVVYKGSIYIGIGNKDELVDASTDGVPNIFERSLIDRTGTDAKTTNYSIKSWREIY